MSSVRVSDKVEMTNSKIYNCNFHLRFFTRQEIFQKMKKRAENDKYVIQDELRFY